MTNELTEVVRGGTTKFKVDLTLDGASVDITGDDVTLVVKAQGYSQVFGFEADVATDGVTGVAHFILDDADTALLTHDAYRWQVVWERNPYTHFPLSGIFRTVPRLE